MPDITSIRPAVKNVKIDGVPAPLNQIAQQAANAGITANKAKLKEMADDAVTRAVESKAFRVKLTDLIGG